MKKKYFYIVLIIAIIIIAGFGLFYYFNNSSNKISVNAGGGKIKVTNIYKNPVKTFYKSDIEFKVTPDYSFYYYAENQSFIITITSTDLITARKNAENDFLSTLQISQNQACNLNVQLGVPYTYSINNAGINFGLSFCPNGKPFN